MKLPEGNNTFFIRLPRGKMKQRSLTVYCTGRKYRLFIKLPRRKIKIKIPWPYIVPEGILDSL